MRGADPGVRPVPAEMVAARLAAVTERIALAKETSRPVRVVAVTKGFGPEAVAAAASAGIEDIGENYAQELLAKVALAPPGVRWHYLGELQRNKLARLAPHVRLWHGLDSEDKAVALAGHCPGAAVLVEVRLSDGPGRHGAGAGDVPSLVRYATAAGLRVDGLMAVGPRGASPEQLRACFRDVARLGRSLGLAELSMGMSEDYELAVAEGATMVRLGRALFGERPGRDAPGPGASRLR